MRNETTPDNMDGNPRLHESRGECVRHHHWRAAQAVNALDYEVAWGRDSTSLDVLLELCDLAVKKVVSLVSSNAEVLDPCVGRMAENPLGVGYHALPLAAFS